MELFNYVKPILKWWWLIVAACLITAISTLILVRQQPPVYQAKTTLVIGRAVYQPNPSSNDLWQSQSLAYWYSDLAKRQPVRQATMNALGMDWLPDYSVRPLPNSQLIEILVNDTLPMRAQVVANELAAQIINQSPPAQEERQENQEFIDQQLQIVEANITRTQEDIHRLQAELVEINSARQIADTEAELRTLETRLTGLQSTYAGLLANTNRGATNTLSVVEPANLPNRPIGPDKRMLVLVSAAIGLALGVGAAYLLEILDDTLKTSEEVTSQLAIPHIGSIAEITSEELDGVYLTKNPRSLTAEAFRSLRTNLEFLGASQSFQVILVSSSTVNEGKSLVSANLAQVLAQAGRRVILVDADLRKPSLHQYFGLENDEGLSDVFLGRVPLRHVIKPWKETNLFIIPSGKSPPNSAELLASGKMDVILHSLKRVVDFVIVDGPPLLITDAALLSAKVDGVLMVVRSGYCRKREVKDAKAQLELSGARVLGFVLNRIPRSLDAYHYRYHYYTQSHQSGRPLDGKANLPLKPDLVLDSSLEKEQSTPVN
jgi:polysaccharide biosynthesis transport protein